MKKRKKIIVKVIAYLFFLVAAYGFMKLAYGKPPMMLPAASHTEAYKAGYYFGMYFGFYILPFILAYLGWRLYKIGTKKPGPSAAEETESPKISE